MPVFLRGFLTLIGSGLRHGRSSRGRLQVVPARPCVAVADVALDVEEEAVPWMSMDGLE